MRSTDGPVTVSKHTEGPLDDVGGGVAPADVTDAVQSSLAAEIISVLTGRPVMSPVELVQ